MGFHASRGSFEVDFDIVTEGSDGIDGGLGGGNETIVIVDGGDGNATGDASNDTAPASPPAGPTDYGAANDGQCVEFCRRTRRRHPCTP